MIRYDYQSNSFFLCDRRKKDRKLLSEFTDNFHEWLYNVVTELTANDMFISADIKLTCITFSWRTSAGEILAGSFTYVELTDWLENPARFMNKFIYRME